MAAKTALLVIDMQNFFRGMTTKALPNVRRLCEHFKSQNRPVIFTQHGHSQEELESEPSPNQLVRKWGPRGSIAYGSEDWELMSELSSFHPPALPSKDSSTTTTDPGTDPDRWPKLLPKNTYDAFVNTNLMEILAGAEIDRVVVCGVMTDCCCDTTARAAFNRGFETWLVGNACGSANQRQHEAGLRGFGFAFGSVMDTQDVLEYL